MNPLIGIAVAVFPEILKLIMNNVGGGTAGGASSSGGISGAVGPIIDQIIKAVVSATGTSDPDEAKKKVATDPAVATDLQVKLAQIALDAHKADLEAAKDQSQSDIDFSKLQLQNTMQARTALADMLKERTPIALTPAIISYIIIGGFFVVLVLLMFGILKPTTTKDENGYTTVIQIVNLCIGALVSAFSTVISFWLGSSLGSKNKQDALIQASTVQQARVLTDPPTGPPLNSSGSRQTPQPSSPSSTPTQTPASSSTRKYGSFVPNGTFSSNPAGSPRSVATNNPGALNYSKWQTNRPGYIGVTPSDRRGNITTIYRTPEHGVAVWYHLINDLYKLPNQFTLQDLAKKYAGSDASPNDVAVYVGGWTHWAKGAFDANTTFLLADAQQMLKLGRAMFSHEAGEVSPLLDAQIEFGITNANAMPA